MGKFKIKIYQTKKESQSFWLDEEGNIKPITIPTGVPFKTVDYAIIIGYVDGVSQVFRHSITVPLEKIDVFYWHLYDLQYSKHYKVESEFTEAIKNISFTVNDETHLYEMRATYLDRSPSDPLYSDTIEISPYTLEELMGKIEISKKAIHNMCMKKED